jgi:hypothetical protein
MLHVRLAIQHLTNTVCHETLCNASHLDRFTGTNLSKRNIRNTYNIMDENHQRKTLIGRPKHKWRDNIKMSLREISSEEVH